MVACTLGIGVLGALVAWRARTGASAQPQFDVLVRHGRIVDGTGKPAWIGDLGIRGDRIVALGTIGSAASARRVIDASDLVVAPGFIDMLGQSEFVVDRYPLAASKIMQGVTSEIDGEVWSPWPRPAMGVRLDPGRRAWATLDDYFKFVSQVRPAINVGVFVTAGSLRQSVMGDATGAPTAGQLATMAALVDTAMCRGAFGVSAALLYAPASYFRTGELSVLAQHAAMHGGGYATHLRSESDSLLQATEEAIAVGKSSGAWVDIHHLKAAGAKNWWQLPQVLDSIRAARGDGVRVVADIYPYTASGALLSVVLPSWVHRGGRDSMIARLGDHALHDRIVTDPAIATLNPSHIIVNRIRTARWRGFEGERLDDIARSWHMSYADALIQLIHADSNATGALLFSMRDADIRSIVAESWVGVGDDAAVGYPRLASYDHPRGFGSFARVFATYVRGEHLLSLEEAVRRVTSLPATTFGLAGRGTLQPGMFADVVVFDPQSFSDRATYANPAELAVGVKYVLVNGTVTVARDSLTGERAGRPLRSLAKGCAPLR